MPGQSPTLWPSGPELLPELSIPQEESEAAEGSSSLLCSHSEERFKLVEKRFPIFLMRKNKRAGKTIYIVAHASLLNCKCANLIVQSDQTNKQKKDSQFP